MGDSVQLTELVGVSELSLDLRLNLREFCCSVYCSARRSCKQWRRLLIDVVIVLFLADVGRVARSLIFGRVLSVVVPRRRHHVASGESSVTFALHRIELIGGQ